MILNLLRTAYNLGHLAYLKIQLYRISRIA